MKRILFVCLLAFMIAGCATSLLPPKYDNNEYYILVRLETHSRFLRDECIDPIAVQSRLEQMSFDAELLNSYSFFLPRNAELFDISKILAEDVREMHVRYIDGTPPSSTYCKLKSKLFTTKARRALQTVGNLE